MKNSITHKLWTLTALIASCLAIASALSITLPERATSGNTLTSANWNTMVDALSQMQQNIDTLQNQLNNKANINQIPSLSGYATLSEVNSRIQNIPQPSSVCPADKTLHFCKGHDCSPVLQTPLPPYLRTYGIPDGNGGSFLSLQCR